MVWKLFGGLAAGATYLVGRNARRRSHQVAAARAAGLQPASDLLHVPASLQRTALWALSDGGFERRVMRGMFAREHGDVDVTAFDLETLRERRGEWAFLPVEPPFRIGGVVSVVACSMARSFPHVLLKHAGVGDELLDNSRLERLGNVAATIRDRLGVKRSYESELPATLPPAPYAAPGLPPAWRAYTQAHDLLNALLAAGLDRTLLAANRRDLVIELVDGLVVVYPAARDVVGPDALADLTTTGIEVVDGVLAASRHVTRL